MAVHQACFMNLCSIHRWTLLPSIVGKACQSALVALVCVMTLALPVALTLVLDGRKAACAHGNIALAQYRLGAHVTPPLPLI